MKKFVLLVISVWIGTGNAVAEDEISRSASPDLAEENYNKICATCHEIGVAGAPRLGDAASWEVRIAEGMDTLYQNSIEGLPPGMPPKGMCFACSDEDIKAIVDYMVGMIR